MELGNNCKRKNIKLQSRTNSKQSLPMFAAFYLHKKYNKMRLREQFLLTKRHQYISSMELGSKRNEWEQDAMKLLSRSKSAHFFGMIAIFHCHNKSMKINAVTSMFAGFNLHKRHKLRLREQFLLTKRHQCISLMELGSKESKNKKRETLDSI